MACPIPQGGHNYKLWLGQCTPLPRHVLPVLRHQSRCLSSDGEVLTLYLLWRCLLVHDMHCSVAQCNQLIPLSVSPNSDKSRKQSLYPDSHLNGHQNLISCSKAHCQPSLKILCKLVQEFLSKVANKQTDRQADNDDYMII